jgi:hypothetical protein
LHEIYGKKILLSKNGIDGCQEKWIYWLTIISIKYGIGEPIHGVHYCQGVAIV